MAQQTFLQSTPNTQIITRPVGTPATGLVADIDTWYTEAGCTRVGRADLQLLDPKQIFFNVSQPNSRLAALPQGRFLQMAPTAESLHGLMVADWLAIDGLSVESSVILPDAALNLIRWRARGERRDRRYIATAVADGWYTGGIDQSGRLLFTGRPAAAAGLTRASHRRLLAGLPGLFFGEFHVRGAAIVGFNNRSRLYRTAEDLGRIAQREIPILTNAHFVAWPGRGR